VTDSTIDDVLTKAARYAVECARAEDLADRLPNGCANLLWMDIPYHGAIDAAWDNVWKTDAAFLAWVGDLCKQWRRILAVNGSLYVFASPAMAHAVETVVRGHFEVLNAITWVKTDPSHDINPGPGCGGRTNKESLRSYFPGFERILFCEHLGAELTAAGSPGYAAKETEIHGTVFEPLRAYLDGERKRAGVTSSAVQKALGNQMAGHYFGRSQWTLPTADNYAKLRTLLDAGGAAEGRPYLRREYEDLRREYEDLRREYEDLRREYEDLRREYEDLRRPFFATAERPYTDVWTYPTVQSYEGKHPCEKPFAMCEDVVILSSRNNDLVVDLFCGGGGIGSAAAKHGRRFIGGDMDDHWADFTRRRCGMTTATGQTTVRKIHKSRINQPSLLDMLKNGASR